jgi:hypothetical protein
MDTSGGGARDDPYQASPQAGQLWPTLVSAPVLAAECAAVSDPVVPAVGEDEGSYVDCR